MFDIQEKVSRSIADALKLKLSPEENRRISERPIENVPAYELYLKASAEIFKFSEYVHGALHFLRGEYDKSLTAWRRLYEMYPESAYSKFSYALILIYNNQHDEAFSIIDQSAKTDPDNVLTKLGLMLKYGVQGEREKAFQEMTPDFQKTCQRDADYAHHLAGAFALLDEKKEALNWLESAVNGNFINYPFIAEQDPLLENIRDEPRFKKLMERVKHEWENLEV